MPEPLSLLDTDSYIEKRLLLFFLLFISFHLYRRFRVDPIRNDSIISVSAIQYRCILYIPIYIIDAPFSFISFFLCNLKYSNGRFFFCRLIFPNKNRGIFHYDLDCFYLDYTLLFLIFFLFIMNF